MSDRGRPNEGEVEAQLLKEGMGIGLAAAAICAGSAQAASYPVPGAPGSADVAAELAMLPKRGEVARSVQQAKPKAAKAKKSKVRTTRKKRR
jgi:hypothetical protein